MVDPRLCSIHLDNPDRRAEFRRARGDVMGSFGEKTLAADQLQLAELEALRSAGQATGAALEQFCLVDQEGVHKLKTGLNTIGRMPDNDVPVSDASVSRRHCAIVVHATRDCEVYDTASKNGTFVNGEKINGVTILHAGDVIRLCDRQFKFLRGRDAMDGANDLTHVDN
jgi:hypothetical protein